MFFFSVLNLRQALFIFAEFVLKDIRNVINNIVNVHCNTYASVEKLVKNQIFVFKIVVSVAI